jgi:hypothetical protein
MDRVLYGIQIIILSLSRVSWCEFYYGRGSTIISSGSQASSEGIVSIVT